jgi:NitT/TauT family transport system substrate-binding protein
MTIKKLLAAAILVLLFVSLGTINAQPSAKPLRIGIFADADSLPFMLCESDKLFAAEGVQVELLRFQSAVERDSALQAGALDGVVSDLLAVMLATQAGFPLKITSLTDGRYGIAASPSSSAKKLSDLAGKSIGISSNTVIHYAVDSLMTAADVDTRYINLLPVPKMPVRLEMVLAGQTEAAGMPEPFLTTARIRGARILAATDDFGLGAGILAFTPSVLEKRLAEVTALYRAYWKAAQRINAAPDSFRPLLVKKAGFPEEAAKAYDFVVYKKPRLPSQADISRASTWLIGKGLLSSAPNPESLLDGRAVSGF